MAEKYGTVRRKCDHCGKEYAARADSLAKGMGRYCSRDCHCAVRRSVRVTITCANCCKAKEVIPARVKDPERGKYCSRACYHAGRDYSWRPLEERFWENVARGGDDECWEWTAALSTGGYGRIMESYKPMQAHRVAWEFTHGPIPEGLHCLHKCDNRKCCNPRHLFVGTNKDNVDGKVSKGRQNRGETSPVSKLTDERVAEMRRRYEAGERDRKKLGAEFGVHHQTAYKIVRGLRWKHV